METTQKQARDFTESDWLELMEDLPHGSGIDCEWLVDFKSDGLPVFHNSWHGMNNDGYYDGYADFSVRITRHKKDVINDLCGPFEGKKQIVYRKGDLDFMVQFAKDAPRGRSWFYGLKDYLEDTIGYFLGEYGIGKIDGTIID